MDRFDSIRLWQLDAREAVHNLSAYFWERGAKTSILDITAAVQVRNNFHDRSTD